MKLLSMNTAIYSCTRLEELAAEFSIGRGDVILTNRYILSGAALDAMSGASVIWKEDYGKGEPTDVMVNAIRAECPRDAKRIIALGGGTVMDVAKLLVLPLDRPLESFLAPDAEFIRERELILVPTTCGTGSEMTNISIITFTGIHFKGGIVSDTLYADTAVLIPQLLEALPAKAFASSLIDALIHSVESYISPKANSLTRMFSVRAMELIIHGMKKLTILGNEHRMDFAGELLLASTLAGVAFGNAGCGAVHAMSYPLGEKYHVPHGLSNYCLFLAVLREYKHAGGGAQLAELENMLAAALECGPEEVYDELEKLLECFYPRDGMNSFGAAEEDIPAFIENVQQKQGRLMANACVPLDAAQLRNIYLTSM